MTQVEAARQASIEAFQQQQTCTRRLQEILPDYLSELRAATEHLEAGGTSESVRSGPAVTARLSLNQALSDLENARRNSRIAVVKLGVAEGRSLSDLGRQWGVSRQYMWALIHAEPTT